MDLSQYIPAKELKTLPRLSITARANEEPAEVAAFFAVPIETLYAASAQSAASFIGGEHLRLSPWFQGVNEHTIVVALLTRGSHRMTPVLVLNRATGELKSKTEVELADNYYDQRVIAETYVEYFA